MSVITKIQERARQITSGNDPNVKPGQPERFTEAAACNDTIRQGDLYVTIIAEIPADYVKVVKPQAIDRQLVPGNTQGAKHCLDSLAGVTLYRPKDWNDESLRGPAFALTKERTVLHPTHGAVTIPKGFVVLCRYQREFDKELQRERRAID